MDSEFEQFDREFGGMLENQFAACDEPIYHPSAGDPFPLTGAIVGRSELVEVLDEQGSVIKQNTITVTVPAATMQAGEIDQIELAAKVEIGGKLWAMNQVGSRQSANWFDLSLVRKPLHRMDPKRNSSQT